VEAARHKSLRLIGRNLSLSRNFQSVGSPVANPGNSVLRLLRIIAVRVEAIVFGSRALNLRNIVQKSRPPFSGDE
jgi:hypothetical protein